jgi:coenzyme F420-reducing hydrogenase gamma subunit
MKYLGIEPKKPRVAVFDFTSCEGCELQLANKEETLVDFLGSIEIVDFREISSDRSNEYDIAMVEGSVTRSDEIERLLNIRERAKTLVALGTCACFGGVNKLKNAFDLNDANREVYGSRTKETLPARAIHEVVKVDLKIPGCPVSKEEVERVVQHVVWDVSFQYPAYPVCLECKQRYTVCVCDLDSQEVGSEGRGQLCLGPITRGGCNAPCPAGGLGCWGCRGPAEDANIEAFLAIEKERGFSDREIEERFEFFGGFEGVR